MGQYFLDIKYVLLINFCKTIWWELKLHFKYTFEYKKSLVILSKSFGTHPAYTILAFLYAKSMRHSNCGICKKISCPSSGRSRLGAFVQRQARQ